LEARIGLSGELSAQAAQVQAPTSEPGMNIAAIYAQRLEEVRVQLDARSLF